MDKSRKVVTVCMVLIVISIIAIYKISEWKIENSRKGGWDAKVPWEYDSDIVEIKYNDDIYILKAKDREDFIMDMKWICYVGEDLETKENIDYDIIVDFKNNYVANISSSNRVVDFRNSKFIVPSKDFERIMKYIK